MNLEPAKLGGVDSEVMIVVSQNGGDIEIELGNFKKGYKLM